MTLSVGSLCSPLRRPEDLLLKLTVPQADEEEKSIWLTSQGGMLRLGNVGDFLKISYACCKGEDLSPEVLEVSIRCQKVMRELSLKTDIFVHKCFRAVNLHSQAVEKFSPGGTNSEAIEKIEASCKIAEGLMGETKSLTAEVDSLWEKCCKVIDSVDDSSSATYRVEADLKEQVTKTLETDTRLRSLTRDLIKLILEEQANERTAEMEAGRANQKWFVQKMASGLISLLGQASQSLETQIARKRIELEKEQRNSEAELVKIYHDLRNLKKEEDSLNQTISSLGLTAKALNAVAVTLSEISFYWDSIHSRLSQLEETSKNAIWANDEKPELFIGEIFQSYRLWRVLGRSQLRALSYLNEAVIKIDRFLSDLPDQNEAKQLIEALPEELPHQLIEES